MSLDVHSYGNLWIYPYASDENPKKIEAHLLYPQYQYIFKKLKSLGVEYDNCYNSLKYVADGVVKYGLYSLLIGHLKKEVLPLQCNLVTISLKLEIKWKNKLRLLYRLLRPLLLLFSTILEPRVKDNRTAKLLSCALNHILLFNIMWFCKFNNKFCKGNDLDLLKLYVFPTISKP